MRHTVFEEYPFSNQKNEDDGVGIQIGNSFRVPTSVSGDFVITGARVYIMNYNVAWDAATGVTFYLHTGETPDFAATPVATATHSSSITSANPFADWREAAFSSPIPLVKGTKYTVSYRFTGSTRAYVSTTDGVAGEIVGEAGTIRIVPVAEGRTYYKYDGSATATAGSGFLACVDLIIDDGEEEELPPEDTGVYVELGTPVPTEAYHVEGWKRTPSNTGLAAVGLTEADLTPYTGGNVITGTVSNKVITATGRLQLKAGAHLDRCLIKSSTDGAISFEGPGGKVTNCDLVMSPSGGAEQVVNIVANYGLGARNGLLVSNVRTTGGHIQLWCDVSATVEDFYAYSQFPETGAEQHRDGFTRRSGNQAEVVIRRSRFVCDQNSTTGAFFAQNTFGDGCGKVESYSCLYEGAGYVLTLDRATDLVFDDCRVWSRPPYQIGPVTNNNSTFKKWENVYQYAPDSPPLYRGSEIPNPTGTVVIPPDETEGPGDTLEQLQARGKTIKYIAVQL